MLVAIRPVELGGGLSSRRTCSRARHLDHNHESATPTTPPAIAAAANPTLRGSSAIGCCQAAPGPHQEHPTGPSLRIRAWCYSLPVHSASGSLSRGSVHCRLGVRRVVGLWDMFWFLAVFPALAVSNPQFVRSRACSPPHESYPFCNTSKSVEERVWDLVHRVRDADKPGLLTARGF
jgi:hypothetical protein